MTARSASSSIDSLTSNSPTGPDRSMRPARRLRARQRRRAGPNRCLRSCTGGASFTSLTRHSGAPEQPPLAARVLTDEFLPGVKIRNRPTTYESYDMICRVHIKPRLGGYELAALTTGAVDALYAELLEGGLSPKSVRNVAGVLHKALTVARKRGLLSANPADDADLPTGSSPDMKFWTPEEMLTFLAATAEDRTAAAWRLALSTGFRRGELLGLRWTDLDLETGQVSVKSTRVRAGKQVVTGPPKTPRRRRTIGLDAGTVAALKAWETSRSASAGGSSGRSGTSTRASSSRWRRTAPRSPPTASRSGSGLR
jgi:integrase